ncbi:MAG: methyltransferase domain-containing protein [Pseudonocardiaceae bacterium]
MTTTVQQLRAEFAARLPKNGVALGSGWREVFASVPREEFVPRFFLHKPGGGMRAVDSGDDDWLTSVYSDRTLVTQLNGDDTTWDQARDNGGTTGRATSSSTEPTLMAWMLDLQPWHHVLEVGTGTGYNAALLSHRLGSDHVTTIDVDPQVVSVARQRLARAGYTPTVIAADAGLGHPDRAPYDRILSTCSWPRIPGPWLEQTRPGGLVLNHLYTELDAGAMVLLRVAADGTATGNFLSEYGAFMPRRDYQRPDTLALLERALRSDDEPIRSPATMPSGEITSLGSRCSRRCASPASHCTGSSPRAHPPCAPTSLAGTAPGPIKNSTTAGSSRSRAASADSGRKPKPPTRNGSNSASPPAAASASPSPPKHTRYGSTSPTATIPGDSPAEHAAYGRARELVEHPTGHQPRWAYYVNPQFVDNACGFYQVWLGMAGSRDSRRQLGNAITLLTPEATAAPDYPYQRDALLSGTALVTAHLGLGELEQAREVGRTTLKRLPHVNSPLCWVSLRRVADQLRARKVNPHVRDFSTELDRRLKLIA